MARTYPAKRSVIAKGIRDSALHQPARPFCALLVREVGANDLPSVRRGRSRTDSESSRRSGGSSITSTSTTRSEAAVKKLLAGPTSREIALLRGES